MSETLAKALIAAQARMINVVHSKTVNAGKIKYDYAELPVVRDMVMPVFQENGLAILQFTSYVDGKSAVVTRVLAKDGAHMDFPVHVEFPSGGDPKGTMSAITYARRAGYKMVAGIAETGEDDDGGAAQMQAEVFVEANAQTNCTKALSARLKDEQRAVKIIEQWKSRFPYNKRTRADWASLWKAINDGEMDKVGTPDPLDTQTTGDSSNA